MTFFFPLTIVLLEIRTRALAQLIVHRWFTSVLKEWVLCGSAHHNIAMRSKICSFFFLLCALL